MGKLFCRLGTKNCIYQLISEIGRGAIWRLTIGETEVNKQLLSRKRSLEATLQSEIEKRKRLEQKVDELQEKVHQQASVII